MSTRVNHVSTGVNRVFTGVNLECTGVNLECARAHRQIRLEPVGQWQSARISRSGKALDVIAVVDRRGIRIERIGMMCWKNGRIFASKTLRDEYVGFEKTTMASGRSLRPGTAGPVRRTGDDVPWLRSPYPAYNPSQRLVCGSRTRYPYLARRVTVTHRCRRFALTCGRMTESANNLLEQVLSLPEHDRAEIANRLLESLDRAPDEEVDEAWAHEIERRCAALDSGEAVTSDWIEFRARIEREVFGR